MFGLSPFIFFMVFGTPLIGILLGLIYGLTFNSENEEWGVIDNLFKKKD
ncbi:hypothetical protein [Alkalihalobacterium alkalinitrilicum]|nr:hypothetical protein [Alkalihalobacterium alkalinitrilicum]